MVEEIIKQVKKIIEPLCPGEIGDNKGQLYQSSDIDDLVKHYEKLGKSKHPAYVLNYHEKITIDYLENVIKHIELDILGDKKVDYLLSEDKDKNDFEKGVMSTIRLIQFRIHCILD